MVLRKDVLRHYINQWDPGELMHICPEDEYDSEIKKIMIAASSFDELDPLTLAKIIHKVCDAAFNFDYHGVPTRSHMFNDTVKDILPMAEKIINDCK